MAHTSGSLPLAEYSRALTEEKVRVELKVVGGARTKLDRRVGLDWCLRLVVDKGQALMWCEILPRSALQTYETTQHGR